MSVNNHRSLRILEGQNTSPAIASPVLHRTKAFTGYPSSSTLHIARPSFVTRIALPREERTRATMEAAARVHASTFMMEDVGEAPQLVECPGLYYLIYKSKDAVVNPVLLQNPDVWITALQELDQTGELWKILTNLIGSWIVYGAWKDVCAEHWTDYLESKVRDTMACWDHGGETWSLERLGEIQKLREYLDYLKEKAKHE